MSRLYHRRRVLKAGLASLMSLPALGLAACQSAPPAAAPTQDHVTMSMFFWGSDTRNTLTKKAIDAFQQRNAGITIKSQYNKVFANYWTQLDGLIAKGQTPDLIQMDMRYLAKYARQGLMYDLTQLIYNQTIGLSDFDPLMLAGSKANNALYGIPLGGNYQCFLYNIDLLERSGVGPLPETMTWDGFADYMIAITNGLAANGTQGVYGVSDPSNDLSTFEIWVRQRGKELYTVDGGLGFAVQDVEDWFRYWDNLRTKGGCLPGDQQAKFVNVTNVTDVPFSKGLCVFASIHTNQFESFQAANKQATLDMTFIPDGPGPGLFFKPSMLISIAAKSPYVDEAARFINFIINDPEGIKAIGIDRGFPGSRRAQDGLRPGFTAAQQKDADFTTKISNSGKTRLKEVLDPPNASQVATLLTNTATDVSLKKVSITDGAKTFYDAARKALGQ